MRRLKYFKKNSALTASSPSLFIEKESNLGGQNKNGFSPNYFKHNSSSLDVTNISKDISFPGTSISDEMSALDGDVSLEITLPNGIVVNMTVPAETAMIDLLVLVTTQNGMKPGGLILKLPSDRPPGYLSYKPSTPIGRLQCSTIEVVRKSDVIQAPKKHLPKLANQPFELTYRIQVDLPRDQKTYLRVNPRDDLQCILLDLCNEYNLDVEDHCLRVAETPSIPLETSRLIGSIPSHNFVLQQISAYDWRKSTGDLFGYIAKMPLEEKQQSKSKGFFGLFVKKRKGSKKLTPAPPLPSENLNLPAIPSFPADQPAKVLPSETQQSSNDVAVSKENGKKKRVAPKPPSEINKPLSVEPTVNNEQKSIRRRNSDCSSGYHEENSTMSHSPASGVESNSSSSNSNNSNDSSLAKDHPEPKKNVSSTEKISNIQKSRKAPPPPIENGIESVQNSPALTLVQNGKDTLSDDVNTSASATNSLSGSDDDVQIGFQQVIDEQQKRIESEEKLSEVISIEPPTSSESEGNKSALFDQILPRSKVEEMSTSSDLADENISEFSELEMSNNSDRENDLPPIPPANFPPLLPHEKKIVEEIKSDELKEISLQIEDKDERINEIIQSVPEPQIPASPQISAPPIISVENKFQKKLKSNSRDEEERLETDLKPIKVVPESDIIRVSVKKIQNQNIQKSEESVDSKKDSKPKSQEIVAEDLRKIPNKTDGKKPQSQVSMSRMVVLDDKTKNKNGGGMTVKSFEDEYYKKSHEDDYLRLARHGTLEKNPQPIEIPFDRKASPRNDPPAIKSRPIQNASANSSSLNLEDQLQQEYDNLQVMFSEWQLRMKEHSEIIDSGGLVAEPRMKAFQRLQTRMVEQHQKVQSLCQKLEHKTNSGEKSKLNMSDIESKFNSISIRSTASRGSTSSVASSSMSPTSSISSTPFSRTPSPPKPGSKGDSEEKVNSRRLSRENMYKPSVDVVRLSRQPSGGNDEDWIRVASSDSKYNATAKPAVVAVSAPAPTTSPVTSGHPPNLPPTGVNQPVHVAISSSKREDSTNKGDESDGVDRSSIVRPSVVFGQKLNQADRNYGGGVTRVTSAIKSPVVSPTNARPSQSSWTTPAAVSFDTKSQNGAQLKATKTSYETQVQHKPWSIPDRQPAKPAADPQAPTISWKSQGASGSTNIGSARFSSAGIPKGLDPPPEVRSASLIMNKTVTSAQHENVSRDLLHESNNELSKSRSAPISGSAPPPPPPPILAEMARVQLKPSGQRVIKQTNKRVTVDVDPQDELMKAIRDFGGSRSLKSVD